MFSKLRKIFFKTFFGRCSPDIPRTSPLSPVATSTQTALVDMPLPLGTKTPSPSPGCISSAAGHQPCIGSAAAPSTTATPAEMSIDEDNNIVRREFRSQRVHLQKYFENVGPEICSAVEVNLERRRHIPEEGEAPHQGQSRWQNPDGFAYPQSRWQNRPAVLSTKFDDAFVEHLQRLAPTLMPCTRRTRGRAASGYHDNGGRVLLPQDIW